jgi:hypothetical protein
VPEVSWAVPGEVAAAAALMGQPDSFLTAARLSLYATKRNDPGVPRVRVQGGTVLLEGPVRSVGSVWHDQVE